MNNNNFLIKLNGYSKNKNKNKNEDIMLKAYWTENITETIKLFDYMKKNDIPITNTAEKNSYYPEYDDEEFYIDYIQFNFGGKEAVPCLEVWVELI